MLRVFAIDVLARRDCGARMRIISTITERTSPITTPAVQALLTVSTSS